MLLGEDGRAHLTSPADRYFVKAQLTSGAYITCNVNGFIYKYNTLKSEAVTWVGAWFIVQK